MGTLRLLLAIAVVFGHSAAPFGVVMTGGANSVQAFYILSGFLIAFVLNERYANLAVFYRARLLRIFPSYWLWLGITLAALLAASQIGHDIGLGAARDTFTALDLPGRLYVLASNLLIVGQEWQYMLTYGPDGLSYTRFFWTESRQLLSVFPLQPAWSLSVELCFYALAPFLVRSPVKIIAVMLAAFALRWSAFRYNFGADPYSYRFFPIEIGTFMLGALSYHVYRATVRWPQQLAPVAAGLLCGLVIMFGFLPQTKLITVMFEDRELLFYGAMVLLLPFAFRFTAKHSWDRLAGEISFPLYLSHWVIVLVLGTMMDRTALFGLAALLLSLFWAALTYWLVDRPLDRYRHRLSLGQPAMQPA